MRNSYIIGFCVFIVVMFLLAFFCLYKAFYVEQETVAGKDSVVRHFVIKDTVVVKQAIYQKRQNVKPRCKKHSECKCCCGHNSQVIRDSLIGNQQ